MFTTYNLADHVLAVSICQKIDQSIMKELKGLINERLKKFDRINLYVEIEDKHGMTLPAMFEDFAFHLKNMGNFEKVAVVTDKEALQKFMELKDALLPTDIMPFDHEERIEAMNWVME